jgi:hypothetical protein
LEIIDPEISVHANAGIEIRAVLNLSRSVNRITDTERELAIRSALNRDARRLCFSSSMPEPELVPETELPIITGKRGNVHGASIVRTPARKDTINKIMFIL